MINYKFILTATLTYIPYTILWFFWHNNVFHKLYYSVPSLYSMNEQNIWAMNIANALLVYGFVYFYFKSVKTETKLYNSILWSVYYNLSVIGFFSFILIGMFKEWSFKILIHDLIWAVIGGAISGVLCYIFYLKLRKTLRS
ncbi:MAG: hypothetical protein L0Y79_06625 [Chlorobi bacterium]|nr:hypothetical protein [Chlorobiota bacterium]MCI0715398.1 hypothetical protein [Chlorobiota bacterium]